LEAVSGGELDLNFRKNPDKKYYVIRIFKPNSPLENFSENLLQLGKDINSKST
jgi:hypothetical protein